MYATATVGDNEITAAFTPTILPHFSDVFDLRNGGSILADFAVEHRFGMHHNANVRHDTGRIGRR